MLSACLKVVGFEGTYVMYLYILSIFICILFVLFHFIFILFFMFILVTSCKHRCYGA